MFPKHDTFASLSLNTVLSTNQDHRLKNVKVLVPANASVAARQKAWVTIYQNASSPFSVPCKVHITVVKTQGGGDVAKINALRILSTVSLCASQMHVFAS
jgi:hypothetical protein